MFQRFMQGRYGVDTLSVTMLAVSFILLAMNTSYLWIVAYPLMVFSLFRILSHRIDKRLKEQQTFMGFVGKLRPLFQSAVRFLQRWFTGASGYFSNWQTKRRQRKDHVFVSCPECKNTLRLPRIKGKLSVTCPVCRHEFIHGK